MSTRLSIRMRGNSLGHHQAIEKEERFSSWRHEEVGKLVWTLGAMAAEHVFYGENGMGVGGDIQSATWRVARMVGQSGMGPEPISLDPANFPDEEAQREAEQEIMDRFQRIGVRIMNRARSDNAMTSDPIAAVLSDPAKQAAAAQILGQAYLTAVCCMRHNRESVAGVADALVQSRELYGDEVIDLLEAAQPEAPTIDVSDRSIWPKV
jgi:cell division protease FtsH